MSKVSEPIGVCALHTPHMKEDPRPDVEVIIGGTRCILIVPPELEQAIFSSRIYVNVPTMRRTAQSFRTVLNVRAKDGESIYR